MISAYNLLETFVEDRLRELALHINQGVLHFADLPEGLQKRATGGLLAIAASRVRRESDVRSFVKEIGASLSAVDGAISLSALSWMWPGSNMSAQDFSAILKAFHVDKPWSAVGALAVRAGLPQGAPDSDLRDFARERHSAAHDSSHQVSNIRIPLIIDQVVKFSLTFDAYASVGADALRRGDAGFLGDSDWTSSVIGIRRIVERPKDWAELSEAGGRALRVGPDRHTLTVATAARCSAEDVLIVYDAKKQILDWTVPAVG